MHGFNKDMLSLARDLRALSQEQTAKALGVSQSKVSKFEGGMLFPSEEELARMSSSFELPMSFFLHPGPKRAQGSSCIYHRKKQSTRVKDLRALHAQFSYLRIQIQELLSKIDLELDSRIHRFDIDSFNGDAEGIAEILRGTWGLPMGPISDLTHAIEVAGGIVVRTPFDIDTVDAMSFWPEDMPPIFFLNARSPGDRLRFSLAHELGHLVMHQVPTGDMEPEADRFASALLMPDSVIAAELGRKPTLQKLAALKPRWRVSIQALIRRAYDLELLTQRQYQSLMMQVSKLGWRKNEPLPIAPESPKTMASVIQAYQDQFGYTNQEIASLAVSTTETFHRYFLEKEDNSEARLRLSR